MFELVIVWSNGDHQLFSGYETREEAEESENNFRMAFGEQIVWSGIRPVLIPGKFNGYI